MTLLMFFMVPILFICLVLYVLAKFSEWFNAMVDGNNIRHPFL